MNIDKEKMSESLQKAAELWLEKGDDLSEIDSRFGDGDHGITIKKIANLMKEKTAAWQDQSFREFFEDLGTAIMGVNGGSAGPLYGTMIGGFAGGIGDEAEITPELLKKMFAASLSEMQDITTAKIGDKTMMDALIPAVEAARQAEDSVEAVFAAAAKAAGDGAKASEQFVSKFGRAKSYKEETIGTPDAGAVSTALFFEGLAEPYL